MVRAMAWIRTVEEGEADGEVRRHYEAATRRAGKVFGIVRLMSPNPAVLGSSMSQYLAIMKGPSPLSRRRREMLAVVVSRVNGCHY
jgi:alkylhydroperoxidase family enzyme